VDANLAQGPAAQLYKQENSNRDTTAPTHSLTLSSTLKAHRHLESQIDTKPGASPHRGNEGGAGIDSEFPCAPRPRHSFREAEVVPAAYTGRFRYPGCQMEGPALSTAY